MTYTTALKSITYLWLTIINDLVVLTASYNPGIIDRYWANLTSESEWKELMRHDTVSGKRSWLSFSLLGTPLQESPESFEWSQPLMNFSWVAQKTIKELAAKRLINGGAEWGVEIVVSKNSYSGDEQYVTQRFWGVNCGKPKNWDDGGETQPDDPDIFPTAPVGPSYIQYMLNENNNWITIDSSSNLLYIEKTTTGETEEDYDGTTDQFHIGYKNLNSISYYVPATIAVNCIITYDRFKDTYVYGDYY